MNVKNLENLPSFFIIKVHMAKNNKTFHLKFLKSVNELLLVTTIISIVLIGLMVLVFAIQGRFSDPDKTLPSVLTIINVAVVSLPIVFLLLCIFTSIVFSSHLNKKSMHVQNLSHLEQLTDIDVLIVNKMGALTDGTFEIKKTIPLTALASEEHIAQVVSNALRVIEESNPMISALRNKYDLELTSGVLEVLPFNAESFSFGATFKGGKTVVIGNPLYVPILNRSGIMRRCEENIDNGYDVLVVAKGKEQIVNGAIVGELEPYALIILKNHVRKDAFDAFKWFKNNNVTIKVVSSNDDVSTSVIAAEAGVDNSDKHISLEGMSIEEIKDVATEYAIFGRATVEQQKALIEAYKENGSKVAVIGATTNDISIMKDASASIAVSNADDETKKAADLAMADASLLSLPLTISESKKFINNMQKAAILYTGKTIFVLTLLLIFTLASLFTANNSLQFPFVFNHIIFWDVVINGVAAFFLVIDEEKKQNKGTFLKNVMKKSIGNAILLTLSVCLIFVFYLLQQNNLLNFGIYTFDTAVAMSVLTFNILGIAILFNISCPLNKRRTITLMSAASINVIAIAVTMIMSYATNQQDVVLQIPYLEMSGPAYLVMAIITIIFASVYIFIGRIIDIRKGDIIKNEN